MNSFSMYKKALSVLFVVILVVVCLAGCNKKAVYRTDTMKYVINNNATIIYNYTYTTDNKPAITTVTYTGEIGESYIDVYGYDEDGDIITYSKRFETSVERNYKAEKITDNKYIFREDDGTEYLTIIFDKTGFIVSSRYANGYVTEYAYTYDENGKPLTFKQLDISPSGNSRITDYTVEFIDEDTYRMKSVGENAIENAYYEVDCTILG